MSFLLGCIADDFTGATDLANTLTREGMSTVVLLGVPRGGFKMPEADAAVVALKSRSNPALDAVRMSLEALDWLRRAGVRQYFFKYCSTFDSTDAGNIGPVADALLNELRESFTVVCPAYPTNGRTVYNGHLFVNGQLLSESSMRNHPLTPMTDSLLTRVLQRQTGGRVALLDGDVVDRGEDAIFAGLQALRMQGYRYAVVDALSDRHLVEIGAACRDMTLLTGGSGLALGLPANYRARKRLHRAPAETELNNEGHAAVIAGSCSAATLRQVAAMRAQCEAFVVDPLRTPDSAEAAAEAAAWARSRLGGKPLLVYSSADPSTVAALQAKLGREHAGSWFERTLAEVARRLVDLGVGRLVVAGGETAGAVVGALGIEGLRIGPEIDPGVPWTTSLSTPPLDLALKSGNFGSDDFFLKAFR
jgi:uncharacterized protein YgbK (DUF1537 family)